MTFLVLLARFPGVAPTYSGMNRPMTNILVRLVPKSISQLAHLDIGRIIGVGLAG